MTLGTMAVDHEMRIDFAKLRTDRLAKTRAQMEKDGLGSVLVFDPDNVRYITSTKLGEWVNNKLNRYTLLAKGHEPILFEIGSAIGTKKALCPWIKDIRPSKGDMRGTMTPLLQASRKVIGEVYEILKGWNLQDAAMSS